MRFQQRMGLASGRMSLAQSPAAVSFSPLPGDQGLVQDSGGALVLSGASDTHQGGNLIIQGGTLRSINGGSTSTVNRWARFDILMSLAFLPVVDAK